MAARIGLAEHNGTSEVKADTISYNAAVSTRFEWTSKSLAAMLCMHGPRGVEGKSFIELIPHGEDKDRLRSIINKSVATSTNADCLHVHMRDAYGSSVLVLLFISGLEGIGNETIYMFGIRGLSDQEVRSTLFSPDLRSCRL